jgi:hypothetical protein
MQHWCVGWRTEVDSSSNVVPGGARPSDYHHGCLNSTVRQPLREQLLLLEIASPRYFKRAAGYPTKRI